MKVIATIFFFRNGNVSTFDPAGQQVPEFQGSTHSNHLTWMVQQGANVDGATIEIQGVDGKFPTFVDDSGSNRVDWLHPLSTQLPTDQEARIEALCANVDPDKIGEAFRQYKIPAHLGPALFFYLTDRQPPGGFLQSVLSNNLQDAVKRADPFSLAALLDIVDFLLEAAPHASWGSPEKFRAWVDPRYRDSLESR